MVLGSNSMGTRLCRSLYLLREITSSCGGLDSGNTSLHIREPVDSFLSGVLSGVLDRKTQRALD